MKRSDLEQYLGKVVTIKLFDNDGITGELHTTGEDRFRSDPTLYIPQTCSFLITPQSYLFKSSHVKKLKEGR